MRKYTRQQIQAVKSFIQKVEHGAAPTDEVLDALARSFDGTEVVHVPKEAHSGVLHDLCGCRLERRWDSTPYNKGYVYELTWTRHPKGLSIPTRFVGRSVEEVFRAARVAFPKPLRRVVGEILAFRGWRVLGEYLISLNADPTSWTGPIAIADRQDLDAHSAHGLYSVKLTPWHLQALIKSYAPNAYGFVGLYGRVIEHEEGYRSSHQVIRRIVLRFPASDAYCKLLSDRYECDVAVERKFRT